MVFYLSQRILEWTAGTEWAERLSTLRLFRCITVRSAGAALTALVGVISQPREIELAAIEIAHDLVA